ncbi:cobalt-precorrin-6A reductase [Amycolatopsis sp. CA-230715]|uniref:cobalt-precorrin-6A reductase n=1 Tax=Amycolatopsis sp. CA-230715 TaxID=2745196 RepID=UPI001C034E37|nr:cobalt-precorrin-6A reductase [Amycolatopsis sp. CA-230715]QWF78352.1 Precorrin-6A reductase [Amycolatopsis sp. CA-230715]
MTVLVLGGTAEARELAAELHARGIGVVSSLAGRVSAPRLPEGEVRIGGFGGPHGFAAWLADQRITAVVDATHPFAERISASAVTACRLAGKPLLRLERPGWEQGPGDDWHWVADLGEAARVAPALGRRIFLTSGRQGLAAFAHLAEPWFLVRCVDPPSPPLPPKAEVVLARGPYTIASELSLLCEHGIDVLVTKDSGGAHTSAKLTACRDLGIPVVLVRRPDRGGAASVATVPAALRWVLGIR